MLRILHIVAPARSGGTESVIRELAVGHRARGHDVSVAAILDPGTEANHPFLDGLWRSDVPVFALTVSTRGYLAERRQIRTILQQQRIQIAHTHGYRPDIVDASVARQLGLASVTTFHGFIGGTRKGRVYEWLQVRAARAADAVVAVSSPIAARLSASGAGARLFTIANAVAPRDNVLTRTEARAVLGLPPSGFVVGWVGRVSQEKGLDVFMRAMARTAPAIRAVVIGDGPQLHAARQLAGELGVSERITFVGLLSDASRHFAAFDAFALTSRTEGTPMVLLEAMWAELPIVATRVGGVPDVVADGSAMLCETENPGAIADAINLLSSDPSIARQYGQAARSRVEQAYSPSAWFTAYEAAYNAAFERATAATRRPW